MNLPRRTWFFPCLVAVLTAVLLGGCAADIPKTATVPTPSQSGQPSKPEQPEGLRLPAPHEIEAMTELDRLARAHGPEVLETLSPSELLLAIAQAAAQSEAEGSSGEEMMAFLPAIHKTLLPVLTQADYIAMISDKAYGDFFRWFVIDINTSLDGVNAPEFDDALAKICSDQEDSEMVRSQAAGTLSAAWPGDWAALFAQVPCDGKVALLRKLSFSQPEAAQKLAKELLESYKAESAELVAFADRTLARLIAGADSDEEEFLELNRPLLQSDDPKLAEGALRALAELDSAAAVALVYKEADFSNPGMAKYVESSFRHVNDCFDTGMVAEMKRWVLAAPIQPFVRCLDDYKAAHPLTPAQAADFAQMYQTIASASGDKK